MAAVTTSHLQLELFLLLSFLCCGAARAADRYRLENDQRCMVVEKVGQYYGSCLWIALDNQRQLNLMGRCPSVDRAVFQSAMVRLDCPEYGSWSCSEALVSGETGVVCNRSSSADPAPDYYFRLEGDALIVDVIARPKINWAGRINPPWPYSVDVEPFDTGNGLSVEVVAGDNIYCLRQGSWIRIDFSTEDGASCDALRSSYRLTMRGIRVTDGLLAIVVAFILILIAVLALPIKDARSGNPAREDRSLLAPAVAAFVFALIASAFATGGAIFPPKSKSDSCEHQDVCLGKRVDSVPSKEFFFFVLGGALLSLVCAGYVLHRRTQKAGHYNKGISLIGLFLITLVASGFLVLACFGGGFFNGDTRLKEAEGKEWGGRNKGLDMVGYEAHSPYLYYSSVLCVFLSTASLSIGLILEHHLCTDSISRKPHVFRPLVLAWCCLGVGLFIGLGLAFASSFLMGSVPFYVIWPSGLAALLFGGVAFTICWRKPIVSPSARTIALRRMATQADSTEGTGSSEQSDVDDENTSDSSDVEFAESSTEETGDETDTSSETPKDSVSPWSSHCIYV